ncbi:hypothetical protein GJAV_G00246830 [Gymnothorax javanicus]|nr:hypothetical protein GJAV_G00246830 [Gymnothorax javanicus]
MRKSEVLAAESISCLNKALCRLKDIWEEIGIPEEQRLQRTDTVKSHIKGLLEMMIAEEESLKRRVINSIEMCRKELDVLCSELGLPAFEEEDGLTMLQLEKDIRTRVEVMMKQKSQRVQELKALRLEDQELCDILCTELFSISPVAVPSLKELENYRQHIVSLTAEKGRRRDEFVCIKRQIILRMEDLEQLPDTSFERDVVCEDEDAFCLSEENIASLKQLLRQLEVQKAENEAICSSYRTKIQELWERLQNREALETEIKRLEELKRQNIWSVTAAIREEIASYWDKCFYSEEQRQAFAPYYNDDVTEEILTLHDAEILRLKQYYEDHKELFEGVRRWEEGWILFQELEKRTTDPSRFNNRGGNLLKEEKRRADLHKSLPKLEKKLKAEIDVWEQEQGCEFFVKGQKFMQYVTEQWETYRLEKEREKQERQLKKSKQTEEDMLYGTAIRTPSKRRMPGAATPGKLQKLNATSSIYSATPNSTLRSVFGGTICRSPVPKTPLSNGLSVRTAGRSKTPNTALLKHNKENISHLSGTALSGASKTSACSQRTFSVNSVASTYSEFAQELSKASRSKRKPGVLNSTVTHI